MSAHRWAVVAIVLASLALTGVALVWANGEFQRLEPASERARPVSRPESLWVLERPYRWFQHAFVWVCCGATVGMAGVVALEGRWRRPWPSGTILVLLAFLTGVGTAASFLVALPPGFKTNGTCYGLRDALLYRVPGVVVGVLAATRGRKMDWRGRCIATLWLTDVGLMLIYGWVFG